jgi:hypothetical protein
VHFNGHAVAQHRNAARYRDRCVEILNVNYAVADKRLEPISAAPIETKADFSDAFMQISAESRYAIVGS